MHKYGTGQRNCANSEGDARKGGFLRKYDVWIHLFDRSRERGSERDDIEREEWGKSRLLRTRKTNNVDVDVSFGAAGLQSTVG